MPRCCARVRSGKFSLSVGAQFIRYLLHYRSRSLRHIPVTIAPGITTAAANIAIRVDALMQIGGLMGIFYPADAEKTRGPSPKGVRIRDAVTPDVTPGASADRGKVG